MVDGLISALILAWFLSLFGFDNIVIEVLSGVLREGVTVTTSHYYFLFGLIGFVGGAFKGA